MNKIKDITGFTLIEVLVSVVIFTISLFVILPLLFTSVTIDKESYLKVQAQNMLTEKMDQILSENITTSGADPEVSIDGFPFIRRWTIEDGTGNLSDITVEVEYYYEVNNRTPETIKLVRAGVERGL